MYKTAQDLQFCKNCKYIQTALRSVQMTSLRDLHTAITDSDAERAIELLDRGVSMIVEHFALATRMKQYKILDYFIQHGWHINIDVSTLTPSCLV